MIWMVAAYMTIPSSPGRTPAAKSLPMSVSVMIP